MPHRTISLRLIVATMVLALAGLIVLQWHLLRQAMELKEQAFRRNAVAALWTAVQKLDAGEAYRSVISATMVMDSTLPPGQAKVSRSGIAATVRAGALSPDSLPLQMHGGKLTYIVKSPQWVRLQQFDFGANRDTVVVDTFKNPGRYEVNINRIGEQGDEMYYRYTADSSHFYLQTGTQKRQQTVSVSLNTESRRAIVNKAMDRLFMIEQKPIEERIRPALLDSVLRSTFHDAGITMGFERGIATEGDTALSLVAPAGAGERLRHSAFRAAFLPGDALSPRNSLVVDFPDQQAFLLSQMGPLFGVTAILMVIIVSGFAYAVRTIVNQRRLAALMTDFVNTMTHEFKTPISTVALAVEAIERPEVASHKDKVQQFNRVIRDETARLRRQVEKILEMATLERGDYELNFEPIDIHALLREVSAGVALQVSHRGGSLRLDLEAGDPMVVADKVHLTNIVNNLLDNANKYSPGKPVIVLTTRTSGDAVVIAVSDEGIGIAPEHVGMVFEKYFRVPTGNRHDVKGFGLGLSYVKLMTEAMRGSVAIRSVVGSGTTVEVTLPAGRRS